jgi:hypothetical protein
MVIGIIIGAIAVIIVGAILFRRFIKGLVGK